MSDTKEFFLDMLHLFGVFLTSGYSIPPSYICDRESYYSFMREHEEIKARKLVYELKRQKLVQIQEKGNEVIFELTHKGKIEAIKQKILSTTDLLPDNTICLVSFDIPENVSKTRLVFRRFLKQAGFRLAHLSVWESKLNVVEPFKELIEMLGIARWVRVYKAERS